MADTDEPGATEVEQVVNSGGVAGPVTGVGLTAQLAAKRHHRGEQTDEQTELALLSMLDEGKTVREAASQLGLSIRTAYHVLGRNEESLDALRTATRRLMARAALDRIEDWKTASEVGARKKGNHAPARDWLLHAGVIDALKGEGTSVSIAINIGTDDRPMRVVSPQDTDE